MEFVTNGRDYAEVAIADTGMRATAPLCAAVGTNQRAEHLRKQQGKEKQRRASDNTRPVRRWAIEILWTRGISQRTREANYDCGNPRRE